MLVAAEFAENFFITAREAYLADENMNGVTIHTGQARIPKTEGNFHLLSGVIREYSCVKMS